MIIFGIAFATVLTLVVVPVMYSLFEGLGYHIKSALMGPRFKEPPQGKSFFFVRRSYVLPVIVIVAIVQVIFLYAGISSFGPWILNTISETVLRAPTLLKLAIETLVFLLGLLFQISIALIFTGIPGLIGLVILMSFRTAEERYVDVSSNGVAITSPVEKIFFSPEEITNVRLSPNKRKVTIQAGLRKITIKNILEMTKTPSKTPLKKWVKGPLPDRKKMQNSILALNNAVKDIIP
ncbi:MAG: hypothetical protein JRF25_12900 [Deltaproteobacteria bacterium]|nr:hypothetical protein [Deltaproteobacteria bacterium]